MQKRLKFVHNNYPDSENTIPQELVAYITMNQDFSILSYQFIALVPHSHAET